jgi:perosamine synthetase
MIPYGRHHIDEEDIAAVVDVLRNGLLTQGPMVDVFERTIAEYVGVRYAVAVANGTAGLHLAALAAGVGPGRTLVTSAITFVASSNAALYAGGRAAFTDVDGRTVNMAPESLADALRRHPDTRAVIPVHFAGLPCDMPAIRALADRAGAVVIEDAAHAMGARYPSGERVGSCRYAAMTVFSFHPVKTIAAGEGGMVTTNDEGLYRRLLRLRSHGINKLDDPLQLPEQADAHGVPNPWYYEMQELGYHYRITDIQCALAVSQARRLDDFLARRRALVARYDAAFAGHPRIRPAQCDGRELSGHHLYVIRIDFRGASISRGQLMRTLRDRGVGTQVHYIPVPGHPHYRSLGHRPEDYPEAMRYYDEALSIPLYFDLTDAQQQLVIDSLVELVR